MQTFDEDQICDMVKTEEGQAYVRSMWTPFIIDKDGKPVRYFKDITDGNMQYVEYDGADEDIVKFDIPDFVTRYGDTSDVYDIGELSHWTEDGRYFKGEHFEDQNQIVRLVN